MVLRLLLLPLLCTLLLFAASDDGELLKRADKLVRSADKTEVFRAYNDYKNLYLRATVDHDDYKRQKALKGIVTAGGILRIDVERYAQELKSFKPLSRPSLKKPAEKTTLKEKAADAELLTLDSIRWRDGRVLLLFDRDLQDHEVNYFNLFDKDNGRYRYIFDVDATMPRPKEELHHGGITRISLAQFKSTKIRLVIENDTPLKLSFKRDGKVLVINPGVPFQAAKKPDDKVGVSSRHHLEKVHWREGKLVLVFEHDLPEGALEFSKLPDTQNGRYRYIFDLHSGMLDKQHDLRHAKIKRISLAQFDTTTLRMVIENGEKLDVDYKIVGKELIIDMGIGPLDAPKSTEPAIREARFDKVIVLDPGHGGKDAGAVGYRNYREKVVVLQIARELSKILKQQGYKVYMTRSGDTFIKLQNRTAFANRKKADLFISIHANAVPKRNADKAYGIETYFLSNDVDAGSERAKRVAKMENSKDLQDVTFYGQQDFINILNREKIKKSERLAYDLQRNILASMRQEYKGIKDGGVREGPFWILVGAQMPAVLVEVGFITHPEEARNLIKRKYQERFAEGLANGINQYFINNP